MAELLNFVLDHEQFRRARLPSLYSDFRYLRINNPNGFLANVTAWKSALSQAAAKGVLGPDTFVLNTGEELVSSLVTREWGRPLALGTVVNESVKTNEFVPLETFLSMGKSVYYKPWIDPWRVLSWGLEVAGLKSPHSGDGGITDGSMVVLKNVEDVARGIMSEVAKRPDGVDRILSVEMFVKEFSREGKGFSEKDLKVLLVFLSRDLRDASVANKTIKFRNSDGELTPVNEHDMTIANLKSMISSLSRQVEILSSKVSTSDAKAREAVKAGNKLTALAALKSKKIAEGSLESRLKSLGQLEEVLVKIEQAANNVELVKQLENSSKVLMALNKKVGGVERVDDVVDKLREQMDETEEVGRILAEDAAMQVDESQVNDEFETLLREEQRKAKMAEDARRLEIKQQEREKAAREAVTVPLAEVTVPLEELNLRPGVARGGSKDEREQKEGQGLIQAS